LWAGERDEEWEATVAARSKLERVTGCPMPTLTFALMLGRMKRRTGARPVGREAWEWLQDRRTATYSKEFRYEDDAEQAATGRLCEWFRRLRAEERCEALRCVVRRAFQLLTVSRRRAAPDRKCQRPLLPGVMGRGQGASSGGPIMPRWAWAKYAMQAAVGN
jgi:hypothetical protein